MGLRSTTDSKALASKASGPFKRSRPEAQYVHGVTIIDRSKACLPLAAGEEDPIPSLLRGQPTCRSCYEGPPCKCGNEPYETEVDVYWTALSDYLNLAFLSVRKCEDIAIAEAKRLGMSCVIIRKEQHRTVAERTKTGKKTGRQVPADWHITMYLGDARDEMLLQGHCYVFVGKQGVPVFKLHEGKRTILEPHEIMQKLTLQEAEPQVYWGIGGSCGYA